MTVPSNDKAITGASVVAPNAHAARLTPWDTVTKQHANELEALELALALNVGQDAVALYRRAVERAVVAKQRANVDAHVRVAGANRWDADQAALAYNLIALVDPDEGGM